MAATRGRHKADIKSTLEKRGLTLRCLDRAHNLPLGTCSFTLREPHVVGEQIIAAALGVNPRELWPQRYRTDGVRLRPQPRENYRTPPQKPKTSETLRCFNANTIEQVLK